MQFFFQVCFQVIDETQLMNSGGIRSVFICLNKTLGLLLKAPPWCCIDAGLLVVVDEDNEIDEMMERTPNSVDFELLETNF